MDEKSKERLQEYTAKDPLDLNESQKAFLRARRGNLNKTQKKKLEEVLKEKPVKVEAPVDPLEVELKDLKNVARDLGVDEKGVKKHEIISGIRTKLGKNWKAELKERTDEKHNPNS